MKSVLVILSIIFIASHSLASAPLDTGLYDDSYIVLDYSGAWTQQANANAFGGNVQQTTSITDSLSFQIYSDGFTVYFVFGVGNDSVDICIDADCTTVSTNGAVARGSAEFTGLATGLKEVTITKTTADASAFHMDALYIHPAVDSEVITQTTLTNEYTYDETSYIGGITLGMDAGQIAILLVLVIIATLNTFQFVIGMFNDD